VQYGDSVPGSFLQKRLLDRILGTPEAKAHVMQLVGDGIFKGLSIRSALEQAHPHLPPVHKDVVEQIHGDVDGRIERRARREKGQDALGDAGRVDPCQPRHPALQEI
jgi:hypothetical protein